ncbi:MAG: glycosyl hydrolase family 18 protein [Chloroflexota bacterium]|nr:glycosyl hydrolase family 18 protein [Chloroflexota bacterium]
MRYRVWRKQRMAGGVAALLLLATLLAALRQEPAPARAALAIRWGFYVTYNPNALVSLQAHADQLNYVSPWFYSVNGQGAVTGSAQPVVNDLLRAKGIKNLPMIRNSNGNANFHNALLDPAIRNSMVAQLHTLVQQNGYDGITIDFEAISPGDEVLLTAFMTGLYRDFKTIGKTVAMALPAKTRPATTGWAGAFNYDALKPWADYFIVMAYDQHYPGGAAGPIAPLPWLNDVANYAGSTLGSDRIIWGIGLYGYDWNTSFVPRRDAEPRTWAETQALAQQFPTGATLDYDYVNQAPHLSYVRDNQQHEVWYENRQSFDAKVSFIQGRNFPGFALWRLGQEDPSLWNSIGGLRSPCTPIAGFINTPSRVYFPQTGHSLSGGFLEYWRAHGGLAIYGYPLSEEFAEASPSDGKVYTVQYFERNRFEFHPELRGTPYIVQLGLLGSQYTARRQFPLSDPVPNSATLRYFAQTGHRLGGGFLDLWLTKGGLAQFGYPLSDEFAERSPTDGRTYTVQYFERARLEYHPEFGGTANEFQLGLLGVWAAQQQGCTP